MDLAQALARFRLSNPCKLADTATSSLWTVSRPEGDTAVLKLLHPGQTEEVCGVAYLQALAGHGAVQVHALDGPAILMEHCPGPTLGDVARSGRDQEATDILCQVIRTLQSAWPDPTRPGWSRWPTVSTR